MTSVLMLAAICLGLLCWSGRCCADEPAAGWEEKAEALRKKARAARKTLLEAMAVPEKVSRGAGVFQAGVAVVDITPDKPVYLDGYWQERLSTRVHDPLYVKALVLDDGRTRLAFVLADLIAYFYSWVDQVRRRQDAVPAENVVICTTHTHGSPCVLGMFGPPGCVDMGYIGHVGDCMKEAIETAAANLRPARLGLSVGQMPVVNGEIPDFARNWHNPGVVDAAVAMARFVDAQDGASIATVVNLGNHNDVLGEHTTEVSADYSSYLCRKVSDTLGGETLVFQRGLGGVEPIPQGVNDIAEADAAMERVSDVAHAAVAGAADTVEWVDAPRLRVRSTPCRFPVMSPEVLRAYAAGLLPLQVEDGVQVNEMVVAEVGPARFLSVPGEPHPEVVFKLDDMMGDGYNFMLAMAQDEIGYVVPAELYNPAGIQELLSAGRDNEAVVLSGAARLLGVDGYIEPECLEGERK